MINSSFIQPSVIAYLSSEVNERVRSVTKKRVDAIYDGHFFLSASNSRPIYDLSDTSGFYLTRSFTSEDKYAMTEG
jgi:hypothetical protein